MSKSRHLTFIHISFPYFRSVSSDVFKTVSTVNTDSVFILELSSKNEVHRRSHGVSSGGAWRDV